MSRAINGVAKQMPLSLAVETCGVNHSTGVPKSALPSRSSPGPCAAERGGNHEVGEDEHRPLQPMRATVHHQEPDADDREEEDRCLKDVEVQGHRLPERDPANHHAERDDEDGDLHRGADGAAQRDLHLVP
eukprot:CAMPEP_0195063558 /NCGR_PEP_ID=MMETSP0448-20130528/9898_1 /TAXON_ID=66468 /ORGANISM="Heterocapsa triquestra, Strain CCMP 448" /LENGTH=130 /DNA_ID=CAMNT_0040094471 /DNA_START=249 /DNA_END=639 /DNA_ORIENTATION=+